eukprot:CAMPEP_0197387408 /NCGR_PEP_ID=MMETSP1165-20131217/504_1 /TAXON_ID=284809 /ORGANISM="Chrysocystis fragilis, Strain CCMP3189" /LENGTH=72 /DNA_ID=CAMNT_0042912727 /DNA_START=36 /DNA_END=254 /DNA_ORIENTATION=+
MKKVITVLLAALAAAVALVPQHTARGVEATLHAAEFFESSETIEFFDVSLDNAAIPDDNTISAARKCGFCIG